MWGAVGGVVGLEPGSVVFEIRKEEGSVERRGEHERFCKRYELKMCGVADVMQHRLERDTLVHRVERVPF